MDIAVYDDDGREMGAGEVGELVCRSVWPGMTQSLWNDDERFIETYWQRFPEPGPTATGRASTRTASGMLHGRSDDTLNVAGQRIGPAEVEAALVEQPGVMEAAAVAMPHDRKGEAIWCFVAMEPETEGDADALADALARILGKPFRPERILFCPALPRTRSGKVVRRAVRATALGEDPGDLSTLENPDALDGIRRSAGLAGSAG